MNDPESLSQLLQVCARKTEDFVHRIDIKHMVWLLEIEEAAKKMFSSDFTAEPELMPKTPSQKRRRKKRMSVMPDEIRDPSGRRISRRRSSVSWSTSVRRMSSRHIKPLDTSIKEETEQQPKKMTRAKAQASVICVPVAEKPLEQLSSNVPNDRFLQVRISADERRSADLQLSELVSEEKNPVLETVVPTSSATPIPMAPPAVADEPSVLSTPEKNGRTAAKLKIAASSTPKTQVAVIESMDLKLECAQPVSQAAKELSLELSNYSVTPTGSKSDRRSVRRSIVGRKSTSCRASLANQYSLASKRESMTRAAVRKSIRRSVSQKKASEMSSSSSYKSYQSSIEVMDEEVTVKLGPKTTELVEAPENPSHSVRTRAFKKITISNQLDTEPELMVTGQSLTLDTETDPDVDDQTIRRKSYKRAVDELSDDQSSDEPVNSPPRKKTPSPPCPPSKVIKPPPHMRSFLHTVQKNQLLMMTPGSIGKSLIAKTFIKRNTPLKVDAKEKERQRLEALRKKEEAELQRKQKIEEGKKRKQEELKLRREERQRKVLQARERVEQLEEEKKKKIEQKFAQIDEKSEKVREDRLAEEKAKKKVTAKKQEDVESRRRQEEEVRKNKAKQLEEEQKKREEEEQERQRKVAEAKKLADMRQAELEREKEQERLRAEKERERLERERALQLQRELERAAEKEQQLREEEERKKKEHQKRLEKERQERLRKETEAKKVIELEVQRLREEQERIAKEKQAVAPPLNVTVDLQNSPACESYEMTPKSCKPPSVKINADDYGMDLNSDDSTDDESKPRKPIPAWASGNQLAQAMCQQYYNPIDVDKFYGIIDSPKLEDLFYKSKPRYYKRTSSAVWHSPPLSGNRQHLAVGYGLKKY
ncbi:inner centromere protein [Dendrobates tinctorius]|uniref:inner centromere protein n=1 Tax=Dendrobates tinctorius TaxID=92724 RepID=UPI003CCA32AA